MFGNDQGSDRKPILLWTACLLMVIVVSFMILPKIVVSGKQIGSSQSCVSYTVQPVSCTILPSDIAGPWKVNVQMTEPLDPNLEGTLISLRASVGDTSTDLRHNQPGFPFARGQLIQVQVVGESIGEIPINSQVVIDAIYTLPSGSSTYCRSLPLTCMY